MESSLTLPVRVNNTTAFADWLRHKAQAVESRLSLLLESIQTSADLQAAMQYSVLGGGKRLRPAMLFAAAEENEQLPEAAVAAACAVELIHCYSLIHDDMPCMDDDDMRRGRAACHKVYGEGMALLAGDCLQSLAFAALADAGLPAVAVHRLAAAAGGGGMGGGQALDLATTAASEEALAAMHRLKTGALFDCALQLGLLCRRSTVTAQEEQALARFSHEFGLLFQIANDLQDAEQDRRAGKPTYATLLSVQQAEARAAEAQKNALDALGSRFPRLADITRSIDY